MSENKNIEVVQHWVELLSRWGKNPQDISRALDLMDPDCEWVLMATGESYRGTEAVRKMAEKSMSAINHTEQHRLEVTNLFGCGNKVCLEYIHGALLTLPGQTNPTPIEMAICIIFECKDGKIAKANEYYEVEQLFGPGKVKPMYADSV